MKAFLTLSVLVALPSAAMAQWVPHPQVLQLKAEGDGAWSISCQLQDKTGKPLSPRLSDGGTTRFNKEVMGGQCAYKAAPDKPLKITIGGDYVCPLPSPEKRICAQTFPAGSSGELEIRRRSRPS